MQTFPNRFTLSLATLACAVTCLAAEPREGRLTALAKLVHDPVPRVRLEALRALAKIPSAHSAELALGVLDQPMDPNLDYALWLTINDLSGPWIAALQSGAWKPEGREKQLEFGLRAIKPEQASQVLGQLLAKHPLIRDGNGPWIELIGSAGTEKELRALLDQVLAGGFDDAATARALTSLGEATRLRKLKPGGSLAGLAGLLEAKGEPVRLAALKLAVLWPEAVADLTGPLAIASAGETSEAVRSAVFALARAKASGDADRRIFHTLQSLASTNQPVAVRGEAAIALANAFDFGKASREILQVLLAAPDETESLRLWRGVLASNERYGGVTHGNYLADNYLDEGKTPALTVAPHVARAGMRVAREGGHSDLRLVIALARGAGLAANTSTASDALVKELAAKAADKGDPHRGEMIFRRADLACLSCHAIGGAGGKVGPDMTSIGASAPIDYLVESVLLPNAKIKEGYHSLIVTTKDGTEYTGTLARETPQEIVLRNAAGAEQPVAKADVAKREQGTLSLMPGGLLDPVGEQDQLDLFAFLSRLGKPGDFDASQGGVARKWRLYVETHTDQQNGQGNAMWDTPLDGKLWSPVYSLVSGQLTRPVMDAASQREVWVGYLAVYAATELQLAQAGPVKLKLEATAGEVWVDGKKIGGPGESTVNLPAGKHRVIVKLDPKVIPDSLRLVSDASFVLN